MKDIVNNSTTLKQYFSYEKSVDGARDIFLDLDRQLKYLHQNGIEVDKINASTIVYDEKTGRFKFIGLISLPSEEALEIKKSNRITLAKLTVGTYLTIQQGFCDYSNIPNDVIRENFDNIEECIPYNNQRDFYYREIFVHNNTKDYYSDYLSKLGGNSKNGTAMVKSISCGNIYASVGDENGFSSWMYYLIIIVLLLVIGVLTYTILMVL